MPDGVELLPFTSKKPQGHRQPKNLPGDVPGVPQVFVFNRLASKKLCHRAKFPGAWEPLRMAVLAAILAELSVLLSF
jgi:hypothetical protein